MTRSTDRRRPSCRPSAPCSALLAALLVLALALAPRAEAYIYWTQASVNGGIGRANLNGTGVNKGFINPGPGVADIAVNDTHIYWTYEGADIIGRANIDGTGVVPDFFRAPGALFCYPRPGGCAWVSLAVDSDHIYWTTLRGNPSTAGHGGIGRAKLDGTGVDAEFISGISRDPVVPPGSLAVDRDYIYWTNFGPGTIGRAKLDGTAVEQSFISGAYARRRRRRPRPHLLDPVPRSRGDDRPRQDRRHRGRAAVHHPTRRPGWRRSRRQAHLLDRIHNRANTDTISRAKLDSTDVQRAFIDRILSEFAIAVDGLGPPGKATAKPTQSQKGKKIVVTVKVKARERLTAKASGEIKVNPTYKLRPKKVQVAAGKSKTLKLKPKKKAARKIATALKRGEKAKAKLTVKLTDLAGNTETEKLRVRLRRG